MAVVTGDPGRVVTLEASSADGSGDLLPSVFTAAYASTPGPVIVAVVGGSGDEVVELLMNLLVCVESMERIVGTVCVIEATGYGTPTTRSQDIVFCGES